MKNGIRENLVRGTKNYPCEVLHFDVTDPGMGVMYHWHPEFEILFCQKGGFHVNIEGHEYIAEDGDIFFPSPDSLHSITSSGVHVIYDAIVAFPSLFLFGEKNDIQERIIDPLINHKMTFPERIQKSEPHWEELARIIQRIVDLNSKPPHHFERMDTTLLLLELFVTLYKSDLYNIPVGENYESERIRSIISYIEKNYTRQITLKELASVCHLSEKYFCTFFKLHTEKTPIQYINCVRINAAALRLIETRETVTSIALECGFENIGYFIRQFSRHTGLSPTEYRKQNSH